MRNERIRRQRIVTLTPMERVTYRARRGTKRVGRIIGRAASAVARLWGRLKAWVWWRWRAIKFKTSRLRARIVRAWRRLRGRT